MESVLFPKYFTDRHEPAHLGWVLVALSIGGLAGALAYPLLLVRGLSRRGPLTDAARLQLTFLVLAIPMIGIGLVSLRLASLRELDEFQPSCLGLVIGDAVDED